MISLKWLLIVLCFYMLYKLVTGPKKGRKGRNPYIRIHYGRSQNRSSTPGRSSTKKGKPSLDNIEEAEYEDITDDKNRVEE